jgi:hypothetical protein
MFTITPATLVWIAIAVVPGFVFHKVFALKTPGQRVEHEKNLLEYIAVSLANFAIWCWLFIPYDEWPVEKWSNFRIIVVISLVCFASPATLAWLWYRIRVSSYHQMLGLDHPTPRGWEFFLTQHKCFFVLFHMKNGKLLGGFFGKESFAATYPQEPEIYVQQAWRVDEEGKFLEEVSGSLGMVVRQSEWERIEFLTANFEGPSDAIQQGNTGAVESAVGTTVGGRSGAATEQAATSAESPSAAGGIEFRTATKA